MPITGKKEEEKAKTEKPTLIFPYQTFFSGHFQDSIWPGI